MLSPRVEEDAVVRERVSSVFIRRALIGTLMLVSVMVVTANITGCTPRLAEMGLESRAPVIERTASDDPLESEVFVTRDGLRLGLRHWDADVPRAIIVALHGMNDYSRAFDMPAPRWAELGITTYAYDQRGFGRSPHVGMWPGAEAMRQDVADFVEVARRRHPGLPVFVLGESMGGAVVMSALGRGPDPGADGYILIAPAVWGWSALPFTHRAALWLSAHTFPWMRVTGGNLDITPSDNLDMLIENGRDPLFLKGTRTDAIYGLVDLMEDAYESGPRVGEAPLLLVYGGRDQIIPNVATETVTSAFPANAGIKFYPGGYHMILRDLEAAPRWDDVAGWVNDLAGQARADAGVGLAPEPSENR